MPEHVPIMVVKGLGTVHRQENGEFKFHSKYSDLQPDKTHYAVRAAAGNTNARGHVLVARKRGPHEVLMSDPVPTPPASLAGADADNEAKGSVV